MTHANNNWKGRAGLLAMALLALSACNDGDDGAPGEPGPETPPPALEITELNIEMQNTGYTESGQISVEFLVTNQSGEGVIGLQSATILAAQLLPAGFTGAGNSTEWRFLASETCRLSAECLGEWEDLRNGFYRYVTAATVTSAEGVTFDANATQRVVVKVGGDAIPGNEVIPPVVNQHVDFTGDGSDALPYSRDMVETAACNACHTDISTVRHGGNYTEMETCVICHADNRISNPENVMTGLSHRFHAESGLAQFTNCESCHAQEEPLADALNWQNNPSQIACGTCHTAIDFVSGQGHPAQADNSNCAACHNPDWTRSVHLMTGQAEALAQFDVTIESITPDLTAGSLFVVLSVTNPVTGEAYESPETLPFLSDLRVYANWGTSFDYTTTSAANIRVTDVTPTESPGPGLFLYTIEGLVVTPGSEMDGGGAAIQGKVCVLDNMLMSCENAAATAVAIKGKTQFFTATELGDANARRAVVDNETCGTCHGDQQLAFHGGNRNELAQQCQLCHNAQMQADATAANPAATNANYSHMVHAIHTAQRESYVDLVYPAPASDCRQCHIQQDGSDSFALPILATVPPMALSDGTFTSVTSATCSVCHSSSGAQTHMTQNGGSFGVSLEMATGETCEVCHGPGRSADTAVVHGLAPAQ
ncbi:OmcA/MtrC family decaheme c-type cytochrome [Ferrimonas marina]|uniref:Decaheme c-type cytochrome, OmcA/MtrC family n=1 Tax=Ferrimonas marina TaxID=299255 RepID=A0A1M5YUN4_9GAMM|nr:OmcA/MtrC family decaheme c-type cytochrome [Ferrimonas marina]SHI15540.1 decaheme c-type cytochrome, OmcA/MtrC family [Ferrimonas marina]